MDDNAGKGKELRREGGGTIRAGRARRIFLVVGLLAFVAMDVGFSLALAKPEGARIASPAAGARVTRDVDVAGDAWFQPGPGALASVRIEASMADGSAVTTSVERLAVRDRGRLLLELSRWRGRLELPSDGEWSLVAIATSTDGREVRSRAREVFAARGGGAGAFVAFGPDHWIPALAILLVAILAARLVRKEGRVPPALAWILAAAIWVNEFLYQPQWFAQGGWSAASALMIQMCGLTILAIPFALLMGEGPVRRRLVELAWFWGIGGATQALLSPDLGAVGFPDFRYFSFFASHGLIIVSAAVVVAENPGRIDLKAFGRVVAITNIIIAPIAAADRLLALFPPHDPGNYFILSYPPVEGSPVDLLSAIFGPAPYYLVGLELLALAIFALLWAPFALVRLPRRMRRTGTPTGA